MEEGVGSQIDPSFFDSAVESMRKQALQLGVNVGKENRRHRSDEFLITEMLDSATSFINNTRINGLSLTDCGENAVYECVVAYVMGVAYELGHDNGYRYAMTIMGRGEYLGEKRDDDNTDD